MASGALKTYLLAARLQDTIRRLGKYRKEKHVDEYIRENEGLGIDIIHGKKPYRSGEVLSKLNHSMAHLKYSECQLEEYGLRAKRVEETREAASGVSSYRKRVEQENKKKK